MTSTSPRYGETARRYSAVSLEGGEIEALELGSTGTVETSVALLTPLRANHSEPLIVIGDNGPARGGEPLRTYLTTPICARGWSACRPQARTSTPTRRSRVPRAPLVHLNPPLSGTPLRPTSWCRFWAGRGVDMEG